MAKYNPTPIKPFPPDIDRDRFGDWLSGFTDGEGYFCLKTIRPKNPTYQMDIKAVFGISLRADDEAILKLIQSFWGCGCVNRIKPRKTINEQSSFQVRRADDLANIVIPHFDKHPLRAKKARDFAIWKEGITLMQRVRSRPIKVRIGKHGGFYGIISRWKESEFQHFLALKSHLKNVRVYDSPPLVTPLAKPDKKEPSLFD